MPKHYCFTDLHGDLSIYSQMLPYINESEWSICLGDCCDRGDQPYQVMKKVLEHKKIIYLKGNHEDMFVKAAKEIFRIMDKNGISPTAAFQRGKYTKTIQHYGKNGGWPTLREWIDDGASASFVNQIGNLPYCGSYTNDAGQHIFLSHAGMVAPDVILNIDCPDEQDKYEMLWSREHFYADYEENWLWDIQIHGHTPIPFITNDFSHWPNRPLIYNDGHKIALDMGTIDSKKAFLLDLDTFEYIEFTSDGKF